MIDLQSIPVATAQAAAGIPFRTDTAVPTGSLAWAVLCTFVVLGVVVGGLLLARKRGWLRTWTGPSPIAFKGSDATLRIIHRLRMSASSRAYVLENDGRRYLVVESSQHVVVHPEAPSSESENAREA
jgi:hypothetical protein